jgi:tetratricopeptide (TPR) repeat protein
MMDREIHKARALVVEPQATMRSILAAQLRDLGVGHITAVQRTRDARLALERGPFDIVLCSREFEGMPDNGQELLDELRRENQLPYSTVFIMLCTSVTYHQVVEAAESALDGLVVRPCSATALEARLMEARKRKRELGPILQALDEGHDNEGLVLAMKRWTTQQPYAGWCGRLAGELLLRLERPDEARKVFETLAAPADAPWAWLGVARAQMATGQLAQAQQVVQKVLTAEPGNADAHDLEGRLLIEQCQFDRALESYRRAADITPSCLLRNQHAGALAFYQGQADAANVWLERAVSLGAQSKLFDALTLALLAMLRHDAHDLSGLRAAAAQLAQYRSRFSGSLRLQRLEQGVGVLMALTEGQLEAAVEQLRKMSACAHDDTFDLEAANLLLGLWARAPAEYRGEAGHESFVRQVGLRFSTGRAITEVLMAAARREEGVVGWLQESQQAVGAVAEQAMERSMAGDAPAAVALLLADARQHFNAKLIDLVLAVGRRAMAQGSASADALQPALDEALQLQTRTCRAANHIAGIQRTGRSPGGLQLRTRTPETADATGA